MAILKQITSNTLHSIMNHYSKSLLMMYVTIHRLSDEADSDVMYSRDLTEKNSTSVLFR